MVFLEGNATGKPVIGGLSGGVTETVLNGHTGLLVDAEVVEQLSGAMTRLLENVDLRRRLGQQGLRRVQEEFGWDSRAKCLRELSLQIIGQNPTRRSR